MPKRKKDPREKVIKNYENKIRILKRSMDLIKDLPLDEPVQITLITHRVVAGTWKEFSEKALVIMRGFNAESFKAQLLAFPDAHPFPNRRWGKSEKGPLYPGNEEKTFAIRIQAIEAWEPVKKDEFACFVSADLHTSVYKRVIDGGAL